MVRATSTIFLISNKLSWTWHFVCVLDVETQVQFFDRTTLQHYRLFQLGLDASHFEIVTNHLLDSLEYSWCEADVIEDMLDLFEPLRASFYHNGGQRTNTNNDEDDGEFEWPLKEETVASTVDNNMTKGTSSSGPCIETISTMKKGIRQLSGENLLNMLKLNRTKRNKGSLQ